MKTLRQITRMNRELNLSVFLLLLVFSSCAVSRTERPLDSDRISKIKSRKYKERELICIAVKQHYSYAKSAQLANGNNSNRFNKRKQNRKPNSHFGDGKIRVQESAIRTSTADQLILIRPIAPREISGLPIQTTLQIPYGTLKTKVNVQGETNKMKNTKHERFVSTLNREKGARPDRGDDINTMVDSPAKSKQLPIKLLFLLPVTALLTFLGLKKLKDLSHKISTWAYMNPWKTRFIIAGSHLLAGAGAILLGEELARQQVFLGEQSRNIMLATFVGTGLLYPVRKSKTGFFRGSFIRQKFHNLGMILSAFMLMVFAGNHNLVRTSELTNNGKTIHQHLIAFYKNSPNGKLFHFAKWMPGQDKPVSTQKRPLSKGGQFALILLAIMVLIVSAIGLAALSCSISCNGMEALAFVVGIGGGFLLVFLFILALRAINRAAKRGSPASSKDI